MKIIFITQSLTKTGSEVVLSNLISRINKNKFQIIGLVTKESGISISEIEPNIPKFCLMDFLKNPLNLAKITLGFLFKKQKNIKVIALEAFFDSVHQKTKADLWYINTITYTEPLEYAHKHKIPCVVHSHELEQMLFATKAEELKRLINYPKLIIACSNAAANTLKILGRHRGLEIIYPSLNTAMIPENNKNEIIRKNLKIDNDSFLWLMSGTTDPNKNPVLFVEIAYQLLQKNTNNHFIWLGNNPNSGLDLFVKRYSEFLGISNKINWMGFLEKEEYYYYFKASDGVILTSTRESFSLVSLEAIYLKKPIISLDCKGTEEVIQKNNGHIIKSWNIPDIVQVMLEVINNKSMEVKDQRKHDLNYFDIVRQAQNWNYLLFKYFSSDI
jgi:glycosyltransferase involved in cell wall biosynthesis